MATTNWKSLSVTLSLHFLFWGLYLIMPLVFMDIIDSHYFTEYALRGVVLVLIFYINTGYLIPRLFMRKKYLKYALSISFCLLIIIGFNLLIHELLHSDHPKHKQHFIFSSIIIRSVFSSLVILGISFSFKITAEWKKSEQKMKATENEKLSTELSFLKSQINPHFLFNTLNNIYSLAYKKSDDAPTAIVKLSQLMRYMLYDSNADQVDLNHEIEYIENYIALQKIRMKNQEMASFEVHGESGNVQIAPMLLIPFVENAFKHGASCNEGAKINIRLEIAPQKIIFTVNNTVGKCMPEIDGASGFGLANVQRRLELLYPAKHQVDISSTETEFNVKLLINFNP